MGKFASTLNVKGEGLKTRWNHFELTPKPLKTQVNTQRSSGEPFKFKDHS